MSRFRARLAVLFVVAMMASSGATMMGAPAFLADDSPPPAAEAAGILAGGVLQALGPAETAELAQGLGTPAVPLPPLPPLVVGAADPAIAALQAFGYPLEGTGALRELAHETQMGIAWILHGRHLSQAHAAAAVHLDAEALEEAQRLVDASGDPGFWRTADAQRLEALLEGIDAQQMAEAAVMQAQGVAVARPLLEAAPGPITAPMSQEPILPDDLREACLDALDAIPPLPGGIAISGGPDCHARWDPEDPGPCPVLQLAGIDQKTLNACFNAWKTVQEASPDDVPTPGGDGSCGIGYLYCDRDTRLLAIGDEGTTLHFEDYTLVIDLGGDDFYFNYVAGYGPGSPAITQGGNHVTIDLTGNDIYAKDIHSDGSGDNFGIYAAGRLATSLAMLMDLEGDDIYAVQAVTTPDFSAPSAYVAGASVGGTNLFFEGEGDDTYFFSQGGFGTRFSEGSGQTGTNVFIDVAGNDFRDTQGFNRLRGMYHNIGGGIYLELGGWDTYIDDQPGSVDYLFEAEQNGLQSAGKDDSVWYFGQGSTLPFVSDPFNEVSSLVAALTGIALPSMPGFGADLPLTTPTLELRISEISPPGIRGAILPGDEGTFQFMAANRGRMDTTADVVLTITCQDDPDCVVDDVTLTQPVGLTAGPGGDMAAEFQHVFNATDDVVYNYTARIEPTGPEAAALEDARPENNAVHGHVHALEVTEARVEAVPLSDPVISYTDPVQAQVTVVNEGLVTAQGTLHASIHAADGTEVDTIGPIVVPDLLPSPGEVIGPESRFQTILAWPLPDTLTPATLHELRIRYDLPGDLDPSDNTDTVRFSPERAPVYLYDDFEGPPCRDASPCTPGDVTWTHTLEKSGELSNSPWRHDVPMIEPFDDTYSLSRQVSNAPHGKVFGYNLAEVLVADLDQDGVISAADLILNHADAGRRVGPDHPYLGRPLSPLQSQAQLVWLDDVRTDGWPQGLYIEPDGVSPGTNGIRITWGSHRLSGDLFGYAIKLGDEWGYGDPADRDTLKYADLTGDGLTPDDPVYITQSDATLLAAGHIRASDHPANVLGSLVEAGDAEVGLPLSMIGPAIDLHYFEDDDDGIFTSGRAVYGDLQANLVSPTMDLKDAFEPVLQFSTYLFEGSSFTGDWSVDVRSHMPDGTPGPYEKVWGSDQGTGGWQRVTVDLTDFEGETIDIQFRAEGTTNTQSVSYQRWYVDDVLVTSRGATDLALDAIVEPLTQFNGNVVGPGDIVGVDLQVRNMGATARRDVPVHLEVHDASGAVVANEATTIPLILPAGDPLNRHLATVTLPWEVPLAEGHYTLHARVADPADIIPSNDARTLEVAAAVAHDAALTSITVTPDGVPSRDVLAQEPRTLLVEIENRGNVDETAIPVRVTVDDPLSPQPLLEETVDVAVAREGRQVIEIPGFIPPAPGQYTVRADTLFPPCTSGVPLCDRDPGSDNAVATLRAYGLLLDTADTTGWDLSGTGTSWLVEADGLRFGGPVEGQTGYHSDSRAQAGFPSVPLSGLREAEIVMRHSYDFEDTYDGGVIMVERPDGRASPMLPDAGSTHVGALDGPGFTGTSEDRTDRFRLGRAEAYSVSMLRLRDPAESLDGFTTAGKPVGFREVAEERWTIDGETFRDGGGSLYNGGNGMTYAQTVPVIDLTDAGYTGATLSFWQRYDLSASSAQAQVFAQDVDGGSLHLLEPSVAGNGGELGATLSGISGGDLVPEWIHTTYDLSDFLGDRLRIRFDTSNNAHVVGSGVNREVVDGDPVHWWIDDIRVHAVRPDEGPASLFLLAATDGTIQDREGWRVHEAQLYGLPYRNNLRIASAQLAEDRPHTSDEDVRIDVAITNLGAATVQGASLQADGADPVDLPDIPADATVEANITLTAGTLALGEHTVEVAIPPDPQDEFPADNTMLVPVSVHDIVDAGITGYHVAPTRLATGDTAHVRFEVANLGVEDFEDVVVRGLVQKAGEEDIVVLEQRIDRLEVGASVPFSWEHAPAQPGRHAFRAEIEVVGQGGTFPPIDPASDDAVQRIAYVDEPFRVLDDTLDDPHPAWSHASQAFLPVPDHWRLDDSGDFGEEGHSPPWVWASHDPETGRYEDNADNILNTPLIDLSASEQGLFVFRHRHDFHVPDDEAGVPVGTGNGDGGWLEVSTDEGASWQHLPHPYPGVVSQGTEETPAFVGRSGWREEAVDLDAYAGQAIHLRYRLVSDAAGQGMGWTIDDVRATSPVRVAFSPDREHRIEDSATKRFTHTLHNLGPLTDTFDLSVVGDVPAGWDVGILHDGNEIDNITLDGLEQAELTLLVRTARPANAPPPEVTLGIHAASRADPSRQDTVLTHLGFDPLPRPDVRITRDSVHLEPGAPMARAPTTFNVVIANSGTVDASDVALRATDIFDGEARTLFEGAAELVPALSSGTINTALVTFQAVLEEPGEHRLRVEVDPDDLIREFDETDNVVETLVFAAPFSAPDIRAETVVLSDTEPLLGDTVRISAPLRNEGTQTATDVQVSFFKDGAMFHSTVVPVLAPGSTAVVTADTGAFPMGERSVLVVAEATGDPDPSDNTAEGLFFVRGFAVGAEVVGPQHQEAGPGDAAAYVVRVRNDGNAPDTVALRASDPTIAMAADPPSLTLEPGEDQTVEVRLTPGLDADVGNRSVTLRIASLGNPLVVKALDLSLDVLEEHVLDVDAPGPRAVRAGEATNLTFTLRNDGNVDLEVRADVDVPDSWHAVSTPRLDVPAGASRQLTVRATAPVGATAGQHTVEVTFRAAGMPDRTIGVPVAAYHGDALRIDGPSQAQAIVGKETPVAFTVHNLGAQDAVAQLRVLGGQGVLNRDQVALPMGGSEEVMLTVAPDTPGSTELQLLATGGGSVTFRTVRIDAVEAGISAVQSTMTPRFPHAGEEVTLQATLRNVGPTASDATRVALIVGGKEVAVQDIPGLSPAEEVPVTFTFVADGEEADVLLQVGEGQAEPVQRLAPADAERESPAPWLALAVALAAVAWRRRR